ncbi:type II toxin-antitoxin system RelE/ParE family toxin [Duganella sp. FT109W]|uniref:Type II toxin-antitoxin system RelE/ParE family toxin n=1 Tax=Duganella margarita TaxID=2692170 RepID=A0ABW9WDK5_9BURK|nr:type II toxin-antitoxin system RelE/ParE family toxin [Duganella margarita]MYN39166.1 type II toxin-antitoxin system RelE/ParE family toxin [Duganella margarita]
MYQIIHYLDSHGRDHYQEWLDTLRDRQAKVAILRRVARLEAELPGDHKPLRDGIQELRIDVGSGYRVYYAFIGSNVVLLACGGNKRSQNRNITAAINMLQDWKIRNAKNRPLS